MLVTMVLLGLVYVAFIAALLVLIRSVLLAQFWFSDRIPLYAMRGRIVTPEEAPR